MDLPAPSIFLKLTMMNPSTEALAHVVGRELMYIPQAAATFGVDGACLLALLRCSEMDSFARALNFHLAPGCQVHIASRSMDPSHFGNVHAQSRYTVRRDLKPLGPRLSRWCTYSTRFTRATQDVCKVCADHAQYTSDTCKISSQIYKNT